MICFRFSAMLDSQLVAPRVGRNGFGNDADWANNQVSQTGVIGLPVKAAPQFAKSSGWAWEGTAVGRGVAVLGFGVDVAGAVVVGVGSTSMTLI